MITFTEIADGDYAAAIGFLPFLPGATQNAAKISFRAGATGFELTGDVVRRFNGLAKADQSKALEIFNKLPKKDFGGNVSKQLDTAIDAVKSAKRVVWAADGLADDLLKHADNVIPKSGFTDVFIHATEDSFKVRHNGKWVNLGHRDLANFLKSKGVTGDIRLISCNAGQRNLAQNLANKLNVTVEAATTKVGVPIDFKSQPLLQPGGKWIPFTPFGN